MENNQFICECGKIFSNPQSFNGHKSNCKIHHINKYGNLDVFNNKYKKVSFKVRNTYELKNKEREQQELINWLAKLPTCERCGIIMVNKFGSGRFCSRKCSNSRIKSEETKEKIRKSVNDHIRSTGKIPFSEKPDKYCVLCGKKINKLSSSNICKSCSNSSLEVRNKISNSLKNNPNAGGLRKGSGTGKHGYYKGYWCDSTYELVYVIYNLDHGILFKRCDRVYEYEYNGEKHKYYPDFELEDGSLIEIKGYYNELVDIKAKAVTDRPISILYKKDIEFAFEYVKNNYTYKKLEDLYDTL